MAIPHFIKSGSMAGSPNYPSSSASIAMVGSPSICARRAWRKGSGTVSLLDRIRRAGMHQGIRDSAANAFALSSEIQIRLLSGFIIGLWIARYLGPESFSALAAVSGRRFLLMRDLVDCPIGDRQ